MADLAPNEAAQLLIQLERFALELVERIDAAVAAQADAAAHVVELGQVVDPQGVDAAQQDQPLDLCPDLSAEALLALVEGVVDGSREGAR